MKILLSDATGYIGRNLKRELEMNGHNVIPLKIFLPNGKNLVEQKKFIDRNLQNLKIREQNIDVFIHLAWMNTNDWNSEQHLSVNFEGVQYWSETLATPTVSSLSTKRREPTHAITRQ